MRRRTRTLGLSHYCRHQSSRELLTRSTVVRPFFEGPKRAFLGPLNVPYMPLKEIRRAYRELARACHPDHGGDGEEFRRIQEAYDAPTQACVADNCFTRINRNTVVGVTPRTMAASLTDISLRACRSPSW
jgi:hypothetical protein